jgi:ABC-type transporter Mla MlaB component
MLSLDVDEQVAAVLMDAGFTTIEEVAQIQLAKLIEIDAIALALLLALRQKARRHTIVNESMEGIESRFKKILLIDLVQWGTRFCNQRCAFQNLTFWRIDTFCRWHI